MTTSTNAHDVVSDQPDLTDVSLEALPAVDTADADAVVERVVGTDRDRQEQDDGRQEQKDQMPPQV